MNRAWAARSAWLITPANSPRGLPIALTCGADVVMVDLEDSVAPDRKDIARRLAQRFLADQGAVDHVPLGLRINALSTGDGLLDLLAIREWPRRPAVVLVPKVESPRDIELNARILDADGYEPLILALVETPRAVADASAIARAERLGGVVFGSADYAAAVGCRTTWAALAHARSVLANAAAAAGVVAIDSPYFAMADLDGLAEESRLARDLGFTGKGAIHPRQIPVIADAFRPTEEEIAHARAIVTAAAESGGGVTSVDGAMVGPPFFRAARALTETVDAGGAR